MIKYKQIALWLLAVTGLLLLMGFGANRSAEAIWLRSTISIKDQNRNPFVNEAEILSQIENHYSLLDSLPLREINIQLLEESLDNHPSIRKAEVYSELNGSLRVDVWQHQPLARVVKSSSDYYLLKNGATMPLSANYSATVPLLTGTISDSLMQPLSTFWEKIADDTFFNNFFSGLHVSRNGDWVLHPKPGHHKVILGKPENWEQKLKKLRIFYENAVNTQIIDSIKTINLKFNNQVICRKK